MATIMSQNEAAPRELSQPVTSPRLRQVRQFGLFAAGAGLLAASIAVSRRSIARVKLATFPPFYSSNRQVHTLDIADRAALGVQALGLASLNIASFGVMLVGGISWAFDLSSVAELRQRTQASFRQRVANLSPEEEREAERQAEVFINSVFKSFGMGPINVAPKDDDLPDRGEPPRKDDGDQ